MVALAGSFAAVERLPRISIQKMFSSRPWLFKPLPKIRDMTTGFAVWQIQIKDP